MSLKSIPFKLREVTRPQTLRSHSLIIYTRLPSSNENQCTAFMKGFLTAQVVFPFPICLICSLICILRLLFGIFSH